MEQLLVLKDSDIFENPLSEPEKYVDRKTSKGIVLDGEGNVAMLNVGRHYGLPGGGVEGNETYEEAFVRECLEEIGCNVQILSLIGNAEQYRARDSKKYKINYFLAKVIGEKGVRTTTQLDEQGVDVVWLPERKVEVVLENQLMILPQDRYNSQFNARTHLAAFKKYLEIKK